MMYISYISYIYIYIYIIYTDSIERRTFTVCTPHSNTYSCISSPFVFHFKGLNPTHKKYESKQLSFNVDSRCSQIVVKKKKKKKKPEPREKCHISYTCG